MPKFTVLIIEDEKKYSDLCRKDPEKIRITVYCMRTAGKKD